MKNITELLNIKYPIIQGAMANISTYELVAAVSNAGGLGVIGSSANDADWMRNQITKTKELTDKPFAVNILLLSPHVKDIAQVVIDEGVKVVTTGAGSPLPFMNAWKEAGITIIPVVPNVALAKRMERYGADAVIAEGTEAGGHIGETTTMTLVPQVVDAVSIPVIAAGGIADHRGVAAAFALGAKGVQAGTVFLTSEETPIHKNYKNIILRAKDTSSVVTGRGTGAPVRVLKNMMATQYLNMSTKGATLEELEKLTLGSLRRAILDGDIEKGSFMAGQISGLINNIRPAKQIVEDLINPVKDYLKNLDVL